RPEVDHPDAVRVPERVLLNRPPVGPADHLPGIVDPARLADRAASQRPGVGHADAVGEAHRRAEARAHLARVVDVAALARAEVLHDAAGVAHRMEPDVRAAAAAGDAPGGGDPRRAALRA